MKTYYGIFYPLEDGTIGVRFPDAPTAITCGKGMDEAVEMAIDALSAIMVCGRKGREYTDPRTFEEVQAEAAEGEIVVPITPSEKAMEAYRPT